MKLDFCVSYNYTQRDLFLPPSTTRSSSHHQQQQSSSRRPQQQQPPPQQLPAAAAAAAAAALALKFHPKHATNKNKMKYIMKIAHISFV